MFLVSITYGLTEKPRFTRGIDILSNIITSFELGKTNTVRLSAKVRIIKLTNRVLCVCGLSQL